MEKDNIHKGHRERLKKRFVSQGLSDFEKHNILELLLFYSIPRKDTNGIAHALLNRFGTIRGVLDADFSELIQVEGVTENTATLIKLIPQIAREYAIEKYDANNIFDTAEKIGEYFVNKYIGETKEKVYAMLLNNRFELLATTLIFEGSVNSAQITPRKIFEQVVKYNASMVVLAHNHPSGTTVPSKEDIDTTKALVSAFKAFNVPIIEHFLIAEEKYCPLIHDSIK